MMLNKIPKEVLSISDRLISSGFQAYLVGGCVRDLLLALSEVEGRGVAPKDWDIATDAKPEEIQKIFLDSVYENEFGTVGVKTDSEDERLKVIEITTFRLEGKYTDKRHPDEIRFAKTIEEDLSRRDFTINAMALSLNSKHEARNSRQIRNSKASNSKRLGFGNSDLDIISDFGFRISDFDLVDPFGGQEDLKNKLIRAVGNANERFQEDALRLMRAPRFAVELGFSIEENTQRAIKENAKLLRFIAKERIRDELIKIINTKEAMRGIQLLEELGLLGYIISELREGINVSQNLHHIYNVWEHNLLSLDYAAKKDYSLEVRMASLLHDAGKPRTKRGEGKYATFYGHDVVSSRMTAKILERLRFPKDFSEKVVRLVRHHLFYYNVGEVTASSVRRLLQKVGVELIDDLVRVREADRIGSGVPKAVPYKLRHFKYMVERVRQDPISVSMLEVDGNDVMEILGIAPGPKVGMVLQALFEEVLDDPKKNTEEYLRSRIAELGELSERELKELAERAKASKEELEAARDRELKEKHWVA